MKSGEIEVRQGDIGARLGEIEVRFVRLDEIE